MMMVAAFIEHFLYTRLWALHLLTHLMTPWEADIIFTVSLREVCGSEQVSNAPDATRLRPGSRKSEPGPSDSRVCVPNLSFLNHCVILSPSDNRTHLIYKRCGETPRDPSAMVLRGQDPEGPSRPWQQLAPGLPSVPAYLSPPPARRLPLPPPAAQGTAGGSPDPCFPSCKTR